MPTSEHEAYRARVAAYFRAHADDPDEQAWLDAHAQEVAMLWELDLGVAREELQRCYATHPRGGDPWDPVVKLPSLHASALLGEPRINRWVRALRCSERLRVLIGAQPPPPGSRRGGAPSVDAHYGLMHRLHDGTLRQRPDLVPPSQLQRERAYAPRPRQRPPVPELVDAPDDDKAARLVDKLRAGHDLPNPDDLAQRLQRLHLLVAVHPSAQRGLLGDTAALVVASDGSPLVTNANGRGHRVCDCPPTRRCACLRVYTDPDASWGYDSYRETFFFFGHHLYELTVSHAGVDLPLSLALSSGNENDQTAGIRAWDRWLKAMTQGCPGWSVAVAVEDAGHDSLANHQFFGEQGIKPVIPLAHPAPRVPAARPDLIVSERGVPLCAAGVEMSSRGSARPGCPLFVCPVKANKLSACPKSPAGALRDQRHGPGAVVALRMTRASEGIGLGAAR